MDNSREVEIPVDADNKASFLFPAELIAYLNVVKADLQKSILTIVYDIDMPRKDIAAVINWQGKLDLVDELMAIHESKLKSEEG